MNLAPVPEQFGPPVGALSTVVVLNDFGWVNGGQSKVAIDSALQLKARGLNVHLVIGRGPVDERLIESGIVCHVVGQHDILSDPSRSRAASTGIWNRAAAHVLTDCLASLDPGSTVIHVHGWAKALSPSIGPVVTRSKIAHVYTLHEYFLACPNGGFYDYGAGEICRRRALGPKCLATRCDPRSDLHKVWRVARQAVLWNAGRMPSGLRELIYLAPEQIDIMRPYMPAEAKWHFLPNPAGLQPTERMRAEDNKTFLFVGRLSPEKGAVIAARAAAMAQVPIAFCGDGEERDAVLQANPNAQMLGWLPQEQIGEWMRKARCLLFPSLWYETYGLVVADALRIGLPALVARNSVAASLIENGISGELVASDKHAWADAICRLESNERVMRFSEGAFRRGSGFADQEDYTTRLIAIYAGAIARKQQSLARQVDGAAR